jgi:hypothetical protein
MKILIPVILLVSLSGCAAAVMPIIGAAKDEYTYRKIDNRLKALEKLHLTKPTPTGIIPEQIKEGEVP